MVIVSTLGFESANRITKRHWPAPEPWTIERLISFTPDFIGDFRVLSIWRSSDHIPLEYFSNNPVSEKRPKYIMSESRTVSPEKR